MQNTAPQVHRMKIGAMTSKEGFPELVNGTTPISFKFLGHPITIDPVKKILTVDRTGEFTPYTLSEDGNKVQLEKPIAL